MAVKLLLALAVVAILVLSGCTTATTPISQPPAAEPPASPPPAPPAEPPAAPPATPPPAPTPSPAVREFSVTAKQFSFTPDTFTADQGDTVRFRLTSADVKHGFFVSGYNKDARIEPGQETVLEFLADQKGTFTISCSVFCGSGHSGMRATLVVQ